MTHLLNSCTWQHQWERPVPYTNNSTAQLIEYWNKNSLSCRTQISNLQTHHILTSQSYSCVAKRNSILYCGGLHTIWFRFLFHNKSAMLQVKVWYFISSTFTQIDPKNRQLWFGPVWFLNVLTIPRLRRHNTHSHALFCQLQLKKRSSQLLQKCHSQKISYISCYVAVCETISRKLLTINQLINLIL